MKAARVLLVALALAGLAACIRYPTPGVEITDERPTIAFKGAPVGSVIYVDGIAMGAAAKFDGKREALLVEPGPHLIEVRDGDRTLLSERVFLGGRATRTFVVR